MRLYAPSPPDWWPFWLVKPRGTAPGHRVESVIVDNGAFNYYRSGEYPAIDKWVLMIARSALRLRARAEEIYVILPDYPNEPSRTILAARSARWLCKAYSCVVVMHYNTVDKYELESLFETYMYDVEADLYAVPMKLPTSIYYSSRARRVVASPETQLRIAAIANNVAQKLGTRLHLLAPSLPVIRRLWALQSIDSIDTTNWTRAVDTHAKKQLGTISARNTEEREQLFKHYLAKICKYVNKLEGWSCNKETPFSPGTP